MTRSDLADKVAFVREALAGLADVPQGTLEEFLSDRRNSAARFRPVIGFRNRVVHLYDRIDPAIVHRIVTEDRQDLVTLLDLLVVAADSAT